MTTNSHVPHCRLLLVLLWLSHNVPVSGVVQVMTLDDLLARLKNQAPTPPSPPSTPSPPLPPSPPSPSSPLSSDTLTTLFSHVEITNTAGVSSTQLPKLRPSSLNQLFSGALNSLGSRGSSPAGGVNGGPLQTTEATSKGSPSSNPSPALSSGFPDLSRLPPELAAHLAESLNKGGLSRPLIIILPQSLPTPAPSPSPSPPPSPPPSPSVKDVAVPESLPMSSSLLEVLNQMAEPAELSPSASASVSSNTVAGRPQVYSKTPEILAQPSTNTHAPVPDPTLHRQSPSYAASRIQRHHHGHTYIPVRPHTPTYPNPNPNPNPQRVSRPQTYHHQAAPKPQSYTHPSSQTRTQPQTYRHTYPRGPSQATSHRQSHRRPQPQTYPQSHQRPPSDHHAQPAYRHAHTRGGSPTNRYHSRHPPPPPPPPSPPPPAQPSATRRPITQSFNNQVRRKAPISFVPKEWNLPPQPSQAPQSRRPYSHHHHPQHPAAYPRPFPTTSGARGVGMVMGPAYNEMVMQQAARFGDRSYYRQHGCIDPSPVLSDMPPSQSLTFTCSAPHADMVCERVAAQMGAPAGYMTMIMSTMNPEMSRLAEKCLTPDRVESMVIKAMSQRGQTIHNPSVATSSTTTTNNNQHHHHHQPHVPRSSGSQGTIHYKRGKRQATTRHHQSHHRSSVTSASSSSSQGQVDCSPLMPLIMARMMGPGEGLTSLLTSEGVAELRKQYLAYSCQDLRVSYTGLPFRMCCPGRVEPPTTVDLAKAIKYQSVA